MHTYTSQEVETKKNNLETVELAAGKAWDERVARRILDDAAAVRVTAGAAVVNRPATVLDACDDIDGVARALADAVAHVRARSCEVSPHDRIESLRSRIAARQQVAPRGAGCQM